MVRAEVLGPLEQRYGQGTFAIAELGLTTLEVHDRRDRVTQAGRRPFVHLVVVEDPHHLIDVAIRVDLIPLHELHPGQLGEALGVHGGEHGPRESCALVEPLFGGRPITEARGGAALQEARSSGTGCWAVAARRRGPRRRASL